MTAVVIVLSLLLGGFVVFGFAAAQRRRRAAKLAAELLASSGAENGVSGTLEECLTDLGARQKVLAAEMAESGMVRRLLEGVLSRMVQGVIVCDDEGKVVFRKYQQSLEASHHGRALVEAAAERVLEEALGKGATDDKPPCEAVLQEEVRLYGPPERFLRISAFVLAGGVAASIEDCTEQDRVEVMRRDFVDNISHELRTPVGAMSLLAETISEEEDEATVDVLSKRMISEAERMTRLIEELAELARVENDPGGERDSQALREVVEEVVERLKGAAEQRGTTVSVSVPDEPIVVLADRLQIASAVHNLLDNALKYSPGGNVNVRVQKLGEFAQLEVQDTGIGIPRRDQERIFERFYRVDRSRTTSSGGIGLGLTIVKHAAINHGGEISVDSLEGEGSTFTLKLPLLKKSALLALHGNAGESGRGTILSGIADEMSSS